MSREEPTSSDRQFPWWHSLPLIGAGTLGGLWTAAGTAFFGRLAFGGIAGADPLPVVGTLLWVVSAGALGGGVAGPPGWAHRPRVVVGVVLAVAWFVYLWLVWRN